MPRYPILTIQRTQARAPKYAIVSQDFDLYSSTFELCGRQGGGHDWQSLAESLLNAGSPKLRKAVTLDSEAGMFCATSNDESALENLAELLRHTFRSKKRLEEAIRTIAAESKPTQKKGRIFSHVLVVHFNGYVYDEFEPLQKRIKKDLGKDHRLIYSPRGGGETTFYIATCDVNMAIAVLKPILTDLALLRSSIIATGARNAKEFSVVWPKKRKSTLQPFNRLCKTVP